MDGYVYSVFGIVDDVEEIIRMFLDEFYDLWVIFDFVGNIFCNEMVFCIFWFLMLESYNVVIILNLLWNGYIIILIC